VGRWVRAGRLEDVPPGRTRYLVLEGRGVLLVNRGGRISALGGRCSHRNLPLEGALLWGDRVECPWHYFLYDAETGENIYPKSVYPRDLPELNAQVRPLPRFAVEVCGDEIWLELD